MFVDRKHRKKRMYNLTRECGRLLKDIKANRKLFCGKEKVEREAKKY
jgi:hypothetical protein